MYFNPKLLEDKSPLLKDGISGDEIFIIKHTNQNFVLKSSIKNNARLEKNAFKQKIDF